MKVNQFKNSLSEERGKFIFDFLKSQENTNKPVKLEDIYSYCFNSSQFDQLFGDANINNLDQYKHSIRALLQHQSVGMKHSQGIANRFINVAKGFYTYYGNENFKEIQKLAASRESDVEELCKLISESYFNNLHMEDREALVKVRLNQGLFRKELIRQFNNTCPVKKVDDLSLLIASHIVDYADCDGEVEAANPDNGLLLSPDVDKLFDRKYISFDKDGNLLVLKLSQVENLKRMGLDLNFKMDKKYLNKQRAEYLELRNEKYFGR